MPSIIKKGTNACSFRLKDKRVITLEPDVLVVLADDVFEQLMKEYGSFINPRTITESNPSGCFLVHRKSDYALGLNREVGQVKDNSSRIEVQEVKEEPVVKIIEEPLVNQVEKPVKKRIRKKKRK